MIIIDKRCKQYYRGPERSQFPAPRRPAAAAPHFLLALPCRADAAFCVLTAFLMLAPGALPPPPLPRSTFCSSLKSMVPPPLGSQESKRPSTSFGGRGGARVGGSGRVKVGVKEGRARVRARARVTIRVRIRIGVRVRVRVRVGLPSRAGRAPGVS